MPSCCCKSNLDLNNNFNCIYKTDDLLHLDNILFIFPTDCTCWLHKKCIVIVKFQNTQLSQSAIKLYCRCIKCNIFLPMFLMQLAICKRYTCSWSVILLQINKALSQVLFTDEPNKPDPSLNLHQTGVDFIKVGRTT